MADDSPFGSGAASDEAQHDSSGDERALSPQDDIDSTFPGMSEYKLSQPGDDSEYASHSTPNYVGQTSISGTDQITHEVHEVMPSSEQELQSDEATEIHLDDNDKIRSLRRCGLMVEMCGLSFPSAVMPSYCVYLLRPLEKNRAQQTAKYLVLNGRITHCLLQRSY
ncbi:hypothetical protein RRF57_013426 [Xylaria bambusicola]|uniref:Uncharacterized protein n=1 Tax=Xylaria bambusicola TaxID=326684 RepID=A0AAN7V2U2_9PEZI